MSNPHNDAAQTEPEAPLSYPAYLQQAEGFLSRPGLQPTQAETQPMQWFDQEFATPLQQAMARNHITASQAELPPPADDCDSSQFTERRDSLISQMDTVSLSGYSSTWIWACLLLLCGIIGAALPLSWLPVGIILFLLLTFFVSVKVAFTATGLFWLLTIASGITQAITSDLIPRVILFGVWVVIALPVFLSFFWAGNRGMLELRRKGIAK